MEVTGLEMDFLSCVEICGFRVLLTATKLTTVDFSFVSLEGHATTQNSEMQRPLDRHTRIARDQPSAASPKPDS